jgi:hypothetical protein
MSDNVPPFTPNMVDFVDDPQRLEKQVWLPGGGMAFDIGQNGKRRYVQTGEGKYVKWLEYHRLNPEVFTMVAALARRMVRTNGGIGARQIMERFRWEMNDREVERGGDPEFKLNNSHIPFYGRALVYSGAVPYVPEMFSTMKAGEPGWWADFLGKLRGAEADAARRAGLEERWKQANFYRMRGADEAPPFELP